MRPDRSDELCRGVLVEQDGVIDDVKGTDQRDPVRFPVDGAGWALEPSGAGVRVETNHQDVAQGTGAAQELDVAGMEDVEHAVGKDDALAEKTLTLEPGDDVFEGKRLRVVVEADPAQEILV